MAKVDANAERATRLLEELQKQSQEGEYPLTVARLRELADATATDEELFKALGHKSKVAEFLIAGKKDPSSPVVLTADAETLAASPQLLEYALGKLASADKPLHALEKVVGRVEKSLQPAFQAALEKLTKETVPAGVGIREVKGKPHFYLDAFPPPPPPEPKKAPALVLAEKLLEDLAARKQAGTVFLPLAELAGSDVKAGPLKKALEESAFTGRAFVLPVSKTLSYVAETEDRGALLESETLLLDLLTGATTPKKPLIALAEVGAALPEAYREEFARTLAEREKENRWPEAIVTKTEGEQTLIGLRSRIPAVQLLRDNVLAEMAHRRERGKGYPASLADLARAVDPTVTEEGIRELAADKVLRASVLFAVAGNPDLPVARLGDEKKLAASPEVIEYAVAQLSTAEAPLHPLPKIAGKVDKALKESFAPAVVKHLADGTLPESLASTEIKKVLHLRLAKFEPPPPPLPPETILAEQLLSRLRQSRETGVYPVALATLIGGIEPTPPAKVIKTALASDAVKFGLVMAVPGHPESLVALAGDQDRLVGDERLPGMVLTATRTHDNQAIPLADLGKKLSREIEATFQATLEKQIVSGSLPSGIGCLMIKKKPHLFLTIDASTPPVLAEPTAPASKDAEEPTSTTPAAATTSTPDFAKMFDDAYRKLEDAGHTLISLVQLRQALPVERGVFDAELEKLRGDRYTLSAAEGHHGLSEEERSAGILDHGELLLYVQRRED